MTPALRHHAAPIALLVLAGIALYGQVVSFRFVQYDDYELLEAHHAEIAGLANPVRALTTDAFAVLGPIAVGVYYRPILVWTYAIESRLFGPDPGVFHAANLVFHLVACVLAYALFAAFGCGRALAAGLAAILLAHPCAALAAAWIPVRNESQLAIAAIGAVLALLAFLRRGSRAALVLCVLCYAAALFTKESGGALLAVLAVTAVVARSGAPGRARGLIAAAGAALGIALLFAVVRQGVLGRSSVGASNALGNLPGLLAYLGKILFPFDLALVPHPADTAVWPGLVAGVLLAAAIAAARRRLLGPAGLGLAWFAAFLLPSALVPSTTWGLEHRIYLPLIGLLLFVSQIPRPTRAPEWLGPALAGAVALVFAILTARRLPDFSGPIRYWESAARTAPHSAFAASRVAWRYYEAGRHAEVPDAVARALAIDSSRPDLFLVRGLGYFAQSDLPHAEPDLRRAVELDPQNPDAWTGLARLQRALGQEDQSRESRRRARELTRSRAAN